MTLRRFKELVKKFNQHHVLVLGDFFLDQYLDLDRRLSEISLETGLEAHQAYQARCSPGGAGNVAKNLRALGVKVTVLGVIGKDGQGYELRRSLRRSGVRISPLIAHNGISTPTYFKPLMKEPDGQLHELNRLDLHNRSPLPRPLQTQIIKQLNSLFPLVDAVVVNDQVSQPNHGVVTNAVRKALINLGRYYPKKIIAVDSRERNSLFKHVILKTNAREALRAIGKKAERNPSRRQLEAAGKVLFKKTQRPLFITIGKEGILVASDQGVHHAPGIPITGPIDTVGAGDSAMAGIVASLKSGATLEEAAWIGNLTASVTIQQIGTTGTASPAQIKNQLNHYCQAKRQ